MFPLVINPRPYIHPKCLLELMLRAASGEASRVTSPRDGSMYVCACVNHLFACVCVYMYMCIYIYICNYMHIHISVLVSVCVHYTVCLFCVHTLTYTHVYINENSSDLECARHQAWSQPGEFLRIWTKMCTFRYACMHLCMLALQTNIYTCLLHNYTQFPHTSMYPCMQ